MYTLSFKIFLQFFILCYICSGSVQINPAAILPAIPESGILNISFIAFRPGLYLMGYKTIRLDRLNMTAVHVTRRRNPFVFFSEAGQYHRSAPPARESGHKKNSVPNRSHPAAELSSVVFVSLSHSRHPKTVRLTWANAFGMSFITRMH